MEIRWIDCPPENVGRRRPDVPPSAIVLHRSAGSLSELRARFLDPTSSLSAHYVVGRDGTIEQYVQEGDVAFHAGVVLEPTWRALRARTNPNLYTVGVDHEGTAGEPWPEEQRAATARLIAAIAQRWSIPVGRDTIVPHSAIRASANCPGAGSPIDEIVERARARPFVAAVPASRLVRTLVHTNVREGGPHRNARVVRVIPANTDVFAAGFTEDGERVDGNACWYVDEAGNFFWAGATTVPRPTAAGGGIQGPLSRVVTTDEMERAAGRRDTGLSIDRTTLTLPPTQYFPESVRKDLIVLHFTAGGNAAGAVASWRSTAARVATAYVVDLDGTIHEVFPPDCWAYHLGLEGRTAHERRSIGIEIVNVGPLQPAPADPRVLNWWVRDWRQPYCGMDESGKYVRRDYRGKAYFATFPEVQMDAVARLVQSLRERFGIARRLPSAAQRLECDPHTFDGYQGVATHANFRPDKWDIGPAFDWDRLAL